MKIAINPMVVVFALVYTGVTIGIFVAFAFQQNFGDFVASNIWLLMLTTPLNIGAAVGMAALLLVFIRAKRKKED